MISSLSRSFLVGASLSLWACSAQRPPAQAAPTTAPAAASSKLAELTGVWQVTDERRSGMAIYPDGEAFEIDVNTCQWLGDVPLVLTETESGATVTREGAAVASLRLESKQVRILSPDGNDARAAVRSTKCPLPTAKPRPGSVVVP